MKENIRFANHLNLFDVRPESGAPILLDKRGGAAQWDVTAQCWVPMPVGEA